MKDEKIFELYEKLYFHEVEAREKIAARLQIPLAIILSITSVYAFLAKGISFDNDSLWNYFFGGVLIVSVILFFKSVSYFSRAFYGHTYEFIPSAVTTEDYRKKLYETYGSREDCDQLVEKYFNKYLFDYYCECSSANTSVNDQRSYFLHKCNTYLIVNAIPLSVAFLVFTLSGIDKNTVDKEYKVKVTAPINFKNGSEPLKIDGRLESRTLEIDFSDDLKGIINERKAKSTYTNTSAPASEEAH
ncbi:hypothetical protein M0G74_07960 [Microbulbifer sp. CAU 1566]|uniref:hypothetical protein n=1 Tax=Microbulbifer sp. CAU 1566 TaxID=2933269 RepID=UPI002006D300|nr:hypothetical protein [Microbulbifer sp. CAU 1566]MCK7597207.1 hypothetical protein [Microbulbifer sp. CAU 1566]